MRCGWFLVLPVALAGCPAGPHAGPHGQAEAPAPVAVRPFGISNPNLVLLITGGTNGLLEVCNCTGPMPGGLARRSGLVRSYRSAFENVLLVDLGDVFWVDPNDVRNRFVLRGYGQLGYDAVVLGDQEWAAGTRRIAELASQEKVNFLAGTVRSDVADLSRQVIREYGTVKLAVLADVRESAFRFVPQPRVEEVSFRPPAELALQVKRLKREGFVVVVAAHMDPYGLESAAAELGADLILRGHTTRTEPKLLRLADTPVVKVGGSEYVGVVAMSVRDGRIVDLEYRAELVDTTWPIDGRLLQTYQAYAHTAMREALDADRTEGLAYVPSAQCGRCHPAQLARWERSRHARAYKTLQEAGRTSDPHCVACHTSGFGAKEGFYTFDKTPQLAGVNCQDCHRFNESEHPARKDYVVPRLTKDICTTCHTPVTDPKFNFKAKRTKSRCPKAPATQPGAARLVDSEMGLCEDRRGR